LKISCFEDFAKEAQKIPKKTIIAVVEAQDEHTLESVIKATNDGIMIPILIGNTKKINELLTHYGADPSEFNIVASSSVEESLQKAVERINSGAANAIMKGKLESGDFMKAIVKKENGLLKGGKLSLIGFYETPKYHKIFAVSDMGLNTYPDLEGKKVIIENAVRLLNALGYENPKVAVLSSIEKVNPKMPDAVDGDALKQMNLSGEITGCTIEGPISFDLSMSRDAARIKGYESPVAGDADLLIVPDIAAGNILVKCLTGFGDAQTAGTVLGAKVPVILTSRSAETEDKYYSIALAACAAAGYK
jgi:phosphotransacetylase